MSNKPATIYAAITLCLVFLTANTAKADTIKTDVVEAGVAIAAIGAGIGIGVYLLIHHSGHSVTGCAVGGAGGLQLHTDSDQTYALIGDVAGVTSGHRVRVSGKKTKSAPANGRHHTYRSSISSRAQSHRLS